jgi:glycosyltransferase involved in cell wall biosynthesis
MRVLHVNKFLYRRGGAESYMFDLAALQADTGDEVAFYGMEHPANEPMQYAGHFPSNVELRESSMTSRVKASARVFYSRSAEAGMKAVLADFKPDAVHLHNIYHHLSPSVLRPLAAAGTPAVMTLHDYKLACPSYQLLDHGAICEACLGGNFLHATMRRCKDGSLAASLLVTVEAFAHRLTNAYGAVDRFIAPSRFLAAKMAEARVFPDRMRHVNHFVDLAAIPARTEPGVGFVFAGRLSPEKGVDVLIDAIGRAGGTHLQVLGEGPERERLEGQAAEVAPGRVEFRGRVTKSEVQEAMASALAVVVPSRWYENQPMTAIEAMAGGTALIGTRLGGIPELVDDGVSGLLVGHDSPDELAEALCSLQGAPDRALEMGREARARIAADFTPALHLERIRDVYAEAGAPRPASVAR